MEKSEIHVEVVDWGRTIRIVPVSYLSTGDQIAYPDGKGGWKFKRFPEGELVDISLPFLTMDIEWAKDLYAALGKIFDPPGPSATEQELTAVKYHLEDMRFLVLGPRDEETKGVMSGLEFHSLSGAKGESPA